MSVLAFSVTRVFRAWLVFSLLAAASGAVSERATAATLSGTIRYTGSMGPISTDVPIGMVLLNPDDFSGVASLRVSTSPGLFALDGPPGQYYLAYYLDLQHNFAGDPDQPVVGAPFQFYDHQFGPFGDLITVPQTGLDLAFDDSHLIPGIAGEVTYTGSQGAGECLVVEAFDNPSFSGDSAGHYNLGNCVLANARYGILFLNPGQAYYLRVCVDLDGNDRCDEGEPFSFYCHHNSPPGDPVLASVTQTNVNFSFSDNPATGGCTLPEPTPTSPASATGTATRTATSTRTPTATATPGILSISGTCRRPGETQSLVPCAAGTEVVVYGCEKVAAPPPTPTRYSPCAAAEQLSQTTTDAQGGFAFELDALTEQTRLLFTATLTGADGLLGAGATAGTTTFQLIDFGPIGTGAIQDVHIDPVSEAAVQLMKDKDHGLDNYSNERVRAVTAAVQMANAGKDFTGLSPDDAVKQAKGDSINVPAVRARLACAADCRNQGRTSIDDLIEAVNIALGAAPVAECQAADTDADGHVLINELVEAVNSALEECAIPPKAQN